MGGWRLERRNCWGCEMASKREDCSTCRFAYELDDESIGVIECRRHPPVINIELADRNWREYIMEEGQDDEAPEWLAQNGHFPTRYDDAWCGEYQPKQGGVE